MRFLIVAMLVLGGCGPSTVTECETHCEGKGLRLREFDQVGTCLCETLEPNPKPDTWCRDYCCARGLAVESVGWGCSCVDAVEHFDKLEKLRAIQCGEEPKQ